MQQLLMWTQQQPVGPELPCALGGGMFLVFALAGVASLAVWIWGLVNAIQNPALDNNTRLLWVLVIVFIGPLGAIVSLLVGRNPPAQPPA